MARRSRQYGRKGRRGFGQVAGGIVLIVGVLLALGFGVYVLVDTRSHHVALDPETYCPKDGPQSVMVVVIDATDALTLVQRTDLTNQVERLIAEVPRHGSLEIYAVGPVKEQAPKPVFLKCNPGRADEINPLTGNPRMVERDWREGFRKPLDETMAQMLSPGEANNSPILDSIQWVAVKSLTPPGRSELPRHLVVVSDLLQHTKRLSFYKGVVDFKAFVKTPYYREVRAPLEGVDVDVLMVRRDSRGKVQGTELVRFWTDYFDTQGAKSLRFIDLAG